MKKENYFALKPLATRLISSTQTQVQIYKSGEGLTSPVAQTFMSIDIEVWARQFLQAVDDFLSLFLPVAAADQEKRSATAIPDALRDGVDRVAKAKAMLAESIADRIDYLFQVPADHQELTRVKKTFQRVLLGGLSAGYAADTLSESSGVFLYHGKPATCMGGLPSEMSREDIPVPLRFYPALPVLLHQCSEPAALSPLDVRQARQWNFEFAFEVQSKDQDTLYVTILFDEAETLGSRPTAVPPSSLFDHLAQFVQVYPDIKSDMVKLLNPDDPGYQAANSAVYAFADIAERVAGSWAGFREETGIESCAVAHAPTQFIYRLERKLAGDPGSVRLDRIILNLVEKAMRPVTNWPSLCVLASDGKYYELIGESAGDFECLYSYNAALPWSDGATIHFVLEDLDAFRTPVVRAGVCVRRNENLGSDPPVRQEFVYQTPLLLFSNACTPPSIQHDAAIDIGQSITDLKGSLSQFFSELFETADIPLSVKLSIEYRFELEHYPGSPPNTAGHQAVVPVLLQTLVPYGNDVGAKVAEAIQEWCKENTPGKCGYFEMSVEVFTSSMIPLLMLKGVTFSLYGAGPTILP